MFVFSRFGAAYQALDAILLLVGLAFVCASTRKLVRDRARGAALVMGAGGVALVWLLVQSWIVLEDGRIPLLFAPIVMLLSLRGFRRLTGGSATLIGGAYVALLLLLGAAPTLFRALFPGQGEGEDVSIAGNRRGLYDAAVVERDDATTVVLRPTHLTLGTILDYPQRTVYAPGFGTEAASLHWESDRRLIVEIYGSGEILAPVETSSGIEVVPSRGTPGSGSDPVAPSRPESNSRADDRPMMEP